MGIRTVKNTQKDKKSEINKTTIKLLKGKMQFVSECIHCHVLLLIILYFIVL